MAVALRLVNWHPDSGKSVAIVWVGGTTRPKPRTSLALQIAVNFLTVLENDGVTVDGVKNIALPRSSFAPFNSS